MSSSVTFRNNEPYDPITLSIWDDKYAVQAPIVLEDATILEDRGDGVLIYEAKMKYVNDAAGQERTVVFYFSDDLDDMDDLKDEADFYVDHLKPMYGNGVPEFYGLYKWEYIETDYSDDDNDTPADCACLVLQYCGEPLGIALWRELENDQPFRRKLVNIIEKLHIKLNIRHNAIYPENVLNLKGEPFIINFSNAEIHNCDTHVAIEEGELRPRPRLLACKELRAFLNALDTWYLPDYTVWHRGLFVENDSIKSAAEIFERRSREGFLEDRALKDEDFWNEAVAAWKMIHSHWAKYHPEDSTIPDLGITDYQEYLAQKDSDDDEDDDDEDDAPAETW
ncbi:hypothetical protein D9615_009758 [Tricholomella constricta]|uniref:Protein kinase domain-containing protein n=1 Tax=Tricholomella constricta TaxID=117010 RepID=A0A8H5GSK7_9AGAR|nr:hypothetical protein D9615_009758 [Tricholomella constricta]